MKVSFRDIIHLHNPEVFETSVYCVVKYKGTQRYYINSTEVNCLLDFIEDLTKEEIFVEEKE